MEVPATTGAASGDVSPLEDERGSNLCVADVVGVGEFHARSERCLVDLADSYLADLRCRDPFFVPQMLCFSLPKCCVTDKHWQRLAWCARGGTKSPTVPC
jgi:hypothetical protein